MRCGSASRVEVYRGTVISGKQMYVEYQVPRQRRHPYPLVLVHGNGGQGFDWMTTPDGRSGWVTQLLQDGYAVYLVDLPGLGRVPYSVELHGPYGQAPTYEQIQRALGAAGATPGTSPASARLHTQWPADGTRAPADESSERARSAREWRVRRPGTDSGRGRVSQAGGCLAEQLRLQDRGLRGNGAMVMLETNRREVFDVLRNWLDRTVTR